MLSVLEKGLYRAGDSLLHRLDPRLKVCACLVLVALAFSATAWSEIVLLMTVLAFTIFRSACATRPLWRMYWMLRWLLLFTLLLHTLFSPGRTLWGIGWLSLDGLLGGAILCVQMLFAVSLGVLLAISTSIEQLTMSFAWFVQPLGWLGCRTVEWQKLMFLSLGFLPLVQEELGRSSIERTDTPADQATPGLCSLRCQQLSGFIVRLIDRGDVIAHRIAADEGDDILPPALPPLSPLAWHDRFFAVTVLVLLLWFWWIG